MNLRLLFIVGSLAAVFIVSSCGNEKGMDPQKLADSLKASVPADLAKLNDEIKAHPDNADAYHNRAKYYLDQQKYDKGFVDMKMVMMLDSTKPAYFITLSDLYFLTNQTGNSKASLEKCLTLDDKNTDAMLKLAEIYFYVKKNDKCFEYINMALKIDKYNTKGYFLKGMNYKDLKDTAKAISSMQTAVEIDQTFYAAYMQLGMLNAGQRNPVAVEYYKNALRVQPNSTDTWYNIGKFYQDMENWEKAMEAYNVLLKIDAKNKNAEYNLASIYLVAKKDYPNALEHYSKALSIDPAYVDAYFGRGVCHQTMGNIKNAEADFKTCLTINPNHAEAKAALGQLK